MERVGSGTEQKIGREIRLSGEIRRDGPGLVVGRGLAIPDARES